MSEDKEATPLGAVFAFLFLLLGVVGLLLPRERPELRPDFHLDGWKSALGALGPIFAADRALLGKYPLDAQGTAAIEGLRAYGRAEARAAETSPTVAAATDAAVALLTRYWFDHGEEAYRALGVRAEDAFVAALRTVMDKARDAGVDVKRWVTAHAADPAVVELHSACGTFVSAAVSWGLVTRDGGFAGGSDALVRIQFRLRWYRFVNDIKDYTELFRQDELIALWRWRVEGDRTLSMKDRLDVARRLERLDPSWPIYRVLGSLYAERGQTEQAVPLLREALLDEPFDAQLRANLAFLIK